MSWRKNAITNIYWKSSIWQYVDKHRSIIDGEMKLSQYEKCWNCKIINKINCIYYFRNVRKWSNGFVMNILIYTYCTYILESFKGGNEQHVKKMKLLYIYSNILSIKQTSNKILLKKYTLINEKIYLNKRTKNKTFSF